jgi:uncharacterized membrane protein YphA (DoxX/SURF4 family)
MEYIFLLSRVLFGGFFLMAGINHIKHLNQMAGYAGSKGVPSPKLAVLVSGIMVLLGGAGIILGLYISISVLLIVLFLIPVTFQMHAFWKDTDPMVKMSNKINFQKNVALLGGALAYLFISGVWPLTF